MARREKQGTTTTPAQGRKARAKAALDALIESVHEDNRVLEGDELVKAVYEIFQVARPLSTYKESK